MKKCPYCAEEIQDEAVKCRYCGGALISPDMRALAARWGGIGQGQRDHEWAGLTEQRQRELTLALAELAERPVTPAAAAAPAPVVVESKKNKTSPVAWGCLALIVLSFAAAILIPNLQDASQHAAANTKKPPTKSTERRLASTVPIEAAKAAKESYNAEKGGNADRDIPIGGGWVVRDVVVDGPKLVVKLRIPDSSGPTAQGIRGAACLGPLEPVWGFLGPQHSIIVEASNSRDSLVVTCPRG